MENLTTIFALLREVTSLGNVSSFLKDKGITHSAGSWDFMRDKRILPALEDGRLTEKELTIFLSEVEESGRQHVFLYKIDQNRADQLMDENQVREMAREAGVENVVNNPIVLDKPEESQIASIRWDQVPGGRALVIKVIETRVSNKKLCEEQLGDGYFTVKYQQVRERAVSMMKVFYNGDVEVRIASQSNSEQYANQLQMFWRKMRFFLPLIDANQVSITSLKNRLWDEKEALANVIRFSSSTLMNDNGVSLRAATGHENADLIQDQGATESLESFMENDGYCDSSNIWFLPQGNGVPSRKIHVILSGQANEFAITVHCKKADYDYVVGKIRSLNA